MKILKNIIEFYGKAFSLPLSYSIFWVISQAFLFIIIPIIAYIYINKFDPIYIKIMLGLTFALTGVAGSFLGTLKLHEIYLREENK